MLIEKPSAAMTMNAAMMDTGIVTAGISVARRLPRNRKITTSTSSIAITSAITTSLHRLLDEHGAVDVDLERRARRQLRRGCARSRRAPRGATSSVFAFEICSMPMLMPGTPFERDRLRSFSAASRTSATSPSRTR